MKTKHILISIILIALLALMSGCELDVNNPNAPTDQEVLTTAEGLKAVAIGMQGRLGNAVEEGIFISGLVSGEIGNTNATPSLTREFQDFPDPGADSQIEDTNPELDDLWTKYYGVVKSADDILQNIDQVQLEAGTRSGMAALAKLMKAIAFATLIEHFQQIPIETATSDTPPFVDRNAATQSALQLLQEAASDIAATAPSDEFNNEILATDFDLAATISAMQARVSLLRGEYQNALSFANAVPASATSVLVYNTLDPNPVNNIVFDLGYFGAIGSFRANAEANDSRVDRFTTPDLLDAFGGATLNGINIYTGDGDPIPVFTQTELSLIRAEANARLNNVSEAATLINGVRRDDAGLLAVTINSQQEALDEIFRQRTYSLFLTGLHWGDLRRFGRTNDAKVEWLPYPFSERSTNSNTPANP